MTQISVEALKQKTIGEIKELEKGFIFIYQSRQGKKVLPTFNRDLNFSSLKPADPNYAEKLVEGLK